MENNNISINRDTLMKCYQYARNIWGRMEQSLSTVTGEVNELMNISEIEAEAELIELYLGEVLYSG